MRNYLGRENFITTVTRKFPAAVVGLNMRSEISDINVRPFAIAVGTLVTETQISDAGILICDVFRLNVSGQLAFLLKCLGANITSSH